MELAGVSATWGSYVASPKEQLTHFRDSMSELQSGFSNIQLLGATYIGV